MAKTTETTKITSTGVCQFCKDEIDKGKMTQHLKFCKQRKAWIETTNSTGSEKIKLFHLLIEGKYLPAYWIHLEIPTDAALADVDGFLRAIWVECCDHLSAFKIGDTSYSSEPVNFYFGDVIDGEDVEEQEEESVEDDELTVQAALEDLPEDFKAMLSEDVLAEIKKQQSIDDLVAYLKETLVSVRKQRLMPEDIHNPEAISKKRSAYYQKLALEDLLEMVEDRSLGVPLEKVLKVGQKFSYEYDFGSTTYLTLKVLAEREGALAKDENGDPDAFLVMARNEPSVIPCRVCGKAATGIAMGYYSAYDGALCAECAKKHRSEDEEMLLPVVNSPRVGVCGYTGDGEWEEDEDEEWDEDDEEDVDLEEEEEE